jgi:hypothetical protein
MPEVRRKHPLETGEVQERPAERNQMLVAAAVTFDAPETVFQQPALQGVWA